MSLIKSDGCEKCETDDGRQVLIRSRAHKVDESWSLSDGKNAFVYDATTR